MSVNMFLLSQYLLIIKYILGKKIVNSKYRNFKNLCFKLNACIFGFRLDEIHDREVQELKKKLDAQNREEMKTLTKNHKDKSELDR